MRALELRPGNPMIRVLPMTLVFELIVLVLAFPGMVYVSHVSGVTAGMWCGIVALLALLGAGMLRRGHAGWALAWLAQIGMVLLGLLTPMMWVVGLIFAGIWAMAIVMGRRIDRATPQS